MILVVGVAAGCTPPPAPAGESQLRVLPPGDALPTDIDSILFGSAQSCGADDECPSQVCYYGSCVGLLLADQRWMQVTMAESLATAVGDHKALKARIVGHLVRLLSRSETDLAYRGRSLAALETLGATQALVEVLASDSAALADGAAMALTRMGHAAGVGRTAKLTAARQPAIAMEALRALGHAGDQGDAPLVALLETLNPALNGGLLRAAVEGLEGLGDRRAVAPLVLFLRSAPPFLQLRIAGCLESLTGARVGISADAWVVWVRSRHLPEAPAVSVRRFSAEESLGFPAP